MEEKLRRLGLGSDATVDPLKGKGKECSEAYMEKIRTEQKDRRRLRQEKEYRRYMSSDQYLKEGNLGAEGKVVQAVVDSARYALAAEKRRAEELIQKIDQKEQEKYSRTARFEKEVIIEKNNFDVVKNATAMEALAMPRGEIEATLHTTTAPSFFAHPKSTMAITRSSDGLLLPCKPPRSSKKHHMAVELCCDVVKALIDLTFLVSDNRFLLGEELTGKPVKSLDQDLKVSEWNYWVHCCLYKKPLGLQEPPGEGGTGGCLIASPHSPKDLCTQELGREHGRIDGIPESVPPPVPFPPITAATDSSNVGGPSALATVCAPMSVEEEMTAELFSLAANFEEIQEARTQREVIGDVAGFLQYEGRRLRKIAVDDIRRLGEEHDKESARSVSSSPKTGDSRRKSTGSVITFVDPLPASLSYTLPTREEVLPHWTHRMPFAVTIVHGDELSGVRLLKEAIERQVRHASSASLSSGLPSKGTQGGGAGTGSVEGGSSETPLSGASPPPPPGVSSGGSGKLHDKPTAVGQHGQERMIGAVRMEDGMKTIFITPRTLLGRGQPMANKEGGNKGTSRHTGGGGTKGAPHHRSLAEDDERKDYEAMTEVLSREIVKVHFHNLYVLTAGKVPPIQLSAIAPAPVDHTSGRRGKSSTNGGGTSGSSGSKKLEEPKHLLPAAEKAVEDESLHCLYLVGFPENEVFYQTLEVRLGPAIEAAEITLVLEQQRLEEQTALQMASTVSATRTRSRSGSIVPKTKPSAVSGSPGRAPNSSGRIGKGTSKNAAVEDTSSLIAQLHAKKVFPPLCILGFFVEYDIPARHRRLKEAYLPWSSSFPSNSNPSGTSSATAPTSGPTLLSATTTGTKSGNTSPALLNLGGGTLWNTGIPYLLHPIYNPEHSTLSSPLFAPTSNSGVNLNASAGSASLTGLSPFTPSLGASSTTTRELLAARSSSEKIALSNNLSVRTDNAGASMVALNLSSGGSTGVGMGVKKKIAAADWDMITLRRELVQRHYRMKHWKTQWKAAMSAPAMMAFRRLASGPQVQSPKEKSKKRGPKSTSGGSSLPSNTSSPATTPPMGTSNSIKEGFSSNVHGSGTANVNSNNIDIYSNDTSSSGHQKEMFTFPKVLYFCHTDCVNDFSYEVGALEEWSTPEGYGQEFSVPCPPSSSPPSFFMTPSGKSHEIESAHVVAVLLRKINGTTRPPLHVMVQSKLVPHILPEPLRLNDYRHPAELCHDLVCRYNLYDQKLFLQKELDAPRSLPGGRPLTSNAFSSSWSQLPGGSGSPLGMGNNGGFPDSSGARPASPPTTEEGGKERERFLSLSACGVAFPKDSYHPSSRFSHDDRSFQQRVLKKDVLRIEMSVFQAFSQHLKDLLHILSTEAFPDSIWSGGRPQNKNFSHTVHYVSIDKNAAELQERMQFVNNFYIEELHWRCALLLRYAVDAAIEATTTAMQNVYEWIQQSFFDLDPSNHASIPHPSTIPFVLASALPLPVTSSFSKTPLSHTAPAVVGTTSGRPSSAIHRSSTTPRGHSSRNRSFNAHPTSTVGSTESTTVPTIFQGYTKLPSIQEAMGNPSDPFSLHPSSAREDETGVPLSSPLAPPVPRARRIGEDTYRLSQEKSFAFLSLLSQGEEKGLQCFWEAFRHHVLVPLQQELEKECREHIQYFTQVQEYQRQLLFFQAKREAQESMANASCAASTPTKETKNGNANGLSSRRNSRKGGARSDGKDPSLHKGSTNRSGSASSTAGSGSNGRKGAAAGAPPLTAFPTLPSLVVAEQTHYFPWSEKHTDPVSELHWDSYIPSIVEIILSKQIASPCLPSGKEHCGTIDASKCPPLLPHSYRTRGQNTAASLPPLHSTNAGGESKEPIFPSSLESSFTMEEGGEGATILGSAGGGTRIGGPPSLPSHFSRSWLPSSSTEEFHHPALRVSSSLGRILITIREALSCANGAKRSAQKWLETMYQAALATPTNETFPDCMRPRTIAQLFSAPPLPPPVAPVDQLTSTPLSPYASPSSDWSREDGASFFTGEPSDSYVWPRLHLELLLSQFSTYKKEELSLEEFLHCASLSQLSQAWRYMNVNLRQLSSNVGYVRECREVPLEVGNGEVRQTSSLVRDEKHVLASLKKREMTIISSPSGGSSSPRSNEVEKAYEDQMGILEGYLPDVLNIACLLRSPCREEPYRTLPFLSAKELVNLFQRSTMSEEESREKNYGRPPQLNIRWWLFNVICRRFCFCQDHRCEFHQAVALPFPSPRELRRAVSLLPECVLYSPSSAIHLLPPYTSRGKKEGTHVMKDQGVPLQWWSYETPRTEGRTAEGRCTAAGTEHVCSKAGSLGLVRHRGAPSLKSATSSTLKRALTRIATSSFCVSKYGVLRQAYPTLPLVLYLLSYYPNSIEDSVSRMFHCFAALMEKSPEPECFFESGGAASLAAAKVNLTVEEFTRLFSCFLHKRLSPFYTFSSTPSFLGGLTPPLPMQTPSVPSFSLGSALCFPALDTVLLEVDAQLLLQVEEREKISLSTLLSSHWGRSLVRSHFT